MLLARYSQNLDSDGVETFIPRPTFAKKHVDYIQQEKMPVFQHSVSTYAHDTRSRNRRQKTGVGFWRDCHTIWCRIFLAPDSGVRQNMFYFATESGDHVIKILICDWSMFNVVFVFVCWSCKFCLCFWLLKLFNLFSLFNMSWTDSQIESLITFYSSVLVSSARNFATGVKNRRQKTGDANFLAPVSGACVMGISYAWQRHSQET